MKIKDFTVNSNKEYQRLSKELKDINQLIQQNSKKSLVAKQSELIDKIYNITYDISTNLIDNILNDIDYQLNLKTGTSKRLLNNLFKKEQLFINNLSNSIEINQENSPYDIDNLDVYYAILPEYDYMIKTYYEEKCEIVKKEIEYFQLIQGYSK